MAISADVEYQRAIKLKEFGWRLVLLRDNKTRDVSRWLGQTLGYRARDLNPYTLEYDGRWDAGPISRQFDGYKWWVAFREEQDYLMYQIKFSD